MSSQMPAIILPLPGTIFIVSVQYSLSFLLLAAMMNSFIISILLVMLVFSTTSSRKRPVFLLNVITLCLAFLGGAFSMYGEIHTMLSPDVPQSTAILLAFIIISYFAAMVAEAILMLRLLAAYPFRLTPRVRFIVMMSIRIDNVPSTAANTNQTVRGSYTISLEIRVLPNPPANVRGGNGKLILPEYGTKLHTVDFVIVEARLIQIDYRSS
ncbi:hypothetical protein AZE42_09056 [Rhizopogon vesiculosus]|uniref:Uncharacterized protein n=1 Tax=Rhizopogon vesiculosus TaxID=180088 RepID=A0A1J8PK40_9AGAM|nr:hypothetical protein AZE42_09056 [Rhizopogon vesiculosus]